MERMTRNFTRSEFACKCGCGLAEPHPMLVAGLQFMMDLLPKGAKCIIHSGSRCQEYNLKIGGTSRSQHTIQEDSYSRAADIHVPGVPPLIMLDAILQVRQFRDGGIGIYPSPTSVAWFHVDVRPYRARWARGRGSEPWTYGRAVRELEGVGE